MTTLGSRIRGFRVMIGLTQAEFAVEMGVTRPTVREWEQDRQSPRLNELFKMARVLGVSPDSLIHDQRNIEAVA